MKKVGLLGLALVLCLAVVGIGYASWTKDLFVNGTVATGVVDAVWVEGQAWDDEPPEKDVSSITCAVDPQDPQILHVTVVNAYPCINYYNEVEIANIGTIPIQVTGIVCQLPEECCTVAIDTPQLPVQIHPGESLPVTIRLHLEQCAPQGQTLAMSAVVHTVQWNAAGG